MTKNTPGSSDEPYQVPEPTDPAEIHFKKAWHLKKDKQYAEAVVEFQASLGIEPDKAATHFNLGLTYDNLGDGPNALKHVLRARELFAQEPGSKHVAMAGKRVQKLSEKYNLEI